jgi:hypothetical protein
MDRMMQLWGGYYSGLRWQIEDDWPSAVGLPAPSGSTEVYTFEAISAPAVSMEVHVGIYYNHREQA